MEQCILLLEISVIQSLETFTVTSLVLRHFVNCIVNSIEVKLFRTFSNSEFIGTCTRLSIHTFFEVGLCVPNNVTKKFGKLGSMLSLFPCIAFESLGYFGITLAVGLTAHCKIHTNFGTLTHKMSIEVFNHLVVTTLCYTDNVLLNKFQLTFYKFVELIGRNSTLRASFGSCITFMNITTY